MITRERANAWQAFITLTLKKHLFSKTLLSIENADACLQHNRNTGER